MKNAVATSKNLDLRCDDAYIFACKVGDGCFSNYKDKGNWTVVIALFINLIDDLIGKLSDKQYDAAREMLCLALLNHLQNPGQTKPKLPEKLTAKQINRRIINNEQIISAVENSL